MDEAEREQRAERERAIAQHPQEQDIQERLDAAAAERLQEVAGDDRRRYGERKRGDESQSRAHAEPAADAAHQQDGGEDVEQHQRDLEDGDRGLSHPEKRRDDPRLRAEHVVLTVEEERKGPELAEMLGHQTDDGLVGVEVDVSVDDEYGGANQHQQHGERGEDQGLSSPTVKDRGDHRQQYSGALSSVRSRACRPFEVSVSRRAVRQLLMSSGHRESILGAPWHQRNWSRPNN